MTVQVVCDGGTGASASAAAAPGLRVVPMYLVVDGVERRDGEVGPREVVEAVRAGGRVTTATPSPGDFLAAAGDGPALVVTVASSLSGGFASACAAGAHRAVEDWAVLDSGSAAGGQLLVATAASRAAVAGAGLAEVRAVAQQVAARVGLVAAVGSLDWLARSGRVPQAVAWVGRTVSLCPVFSLQAGRVHRHRPALGWPTAAERLVETCRRNRPTVAARLHVAAMHGDDPDVGAELLHRVADGVEVAEAHRIGFSAGMVAHAGPDVAGLAWWWEPVDG